MTMDTRRSFLATSLSAGVLIAGCLALEDGGSSDDQSSGRSNGNEPTDFSERFHNPNYEYVVGHQSGEYARTVVTDPAIDGAVVASIDGSVGRYTTDADPVWQEKTGDELVRTSIVSTQTGSEPLVHVADDGLRVYGFNAATGERVWESESVLRDDTPQEEVRRAVVEPLGDTLVGFFSNISNQTTVEGFDPETGERRWVTRPEEHDDRYDHLVWGSSENTPHPDGRLLFDMGNRTGSIDEDGDLEWKPEIYSRIGTLSTPGTVGGNAIYFATGVALVKYIPEAEEEVWSFEAMDSITSAITIHDDLVVFGAEDNGVYAVERASGNQVWRFQTDDFVRAEPVAVGDTVYVGSTDQTVYAIDSNQGEARATIELDGAIGSIERSGQRLYVGTESGFYGVDY